MQDGGVNVSGNSAECQLEYRTPGLRSIGQILLTKL
jgi:hypothetical protein